MKFKFLLTTVLASLLFISSCKKDTPMDPPAQTYPIEGLWIGTYSVDQIPEQGGLFYSFIIYPGGVLLTKGKGGDGNDHYSTGTWTLTSSNIFSGTITTFPSDAAGLTVTQNITATYSNTGELTNGIWHDADNPYGSPLSGKFSTMQRVN